MYNTPAYPLFKMNLHFTLTGFLILFGLYFFSQTSISAQSAVKKDFNAISNLEKASFQNSSLKRGSTPGLENYDIRYHRLEFKVDPNVLYINGKITTYFVPVVTGFNTIDFELINQLQTDSIFYHNTKLTFTHIGSNLKINLPSVIATGTVDSISVYYHGIPANSGMGSFTIGKHNGTPVLWSLSEPNGASDWWPCKPTLNDKIDSIDVIITTPMAYRAASNGLLISETIKGTDKIYHWQSHYPIASYLIAIAVTNYAVYQDFMVQSNGDTLQLLNYIYPENTVNLPQLSNIKDIIKIYDSLTIPYPFSKEKYGHAQFGWSGGMEHQTMSFVKDFSFSLIAHECAHQWFGDRATCGSWHDIWLNEGFATYFEALSEENLLAPYNWASWKQNAKDYITSSPGGSVYCPDTLDGNRIFDSRLSYNKGAFLLHMLRWKLGDSLFFLSIKNYLNDPKVAYGFGNTATLKSHLENTGQQNLAKFFNQWFYGEGYPTYKVQCTYNWGKITVKLDQTTSHNSVAFYEMPVPVRFQDGSHDTTLVFNHTFSGETFDAQLDFKPALISFDPKVWLISGNNTVNYTVLGINQADEPQSEINLFPNPTENTLHVSANFNFEKGNLVLRNMLGEIVYQRILNLKTGDNQFDVDLTTLSSGVYSLEIADEGHFFSRKVVKQ